MMIDIIPGNGKQECYSCQPYLELLVDERLGLFNKYKNASFTFKCEILSYVLDYPGIGKVFNCCAPGAHKAYPLCEIEGKENVLTYCIYSRVSV